MGFSAQSKLFFVKRGKMLRRFQEKAFLFSKKMINSGLSPGIFVTAPFFAPPGFWECLFCLFAFIRLAFFIKISRRMKMYSAVSRKSGPSDRHGEVGFANGTGGKSGGR
jgi:hypothetical protein